MGERLILMTFYRRLKSGNYSVGKGLYVVSEDGLNYKPINGKSKEVKFSELDVEIQKKFNFNTDTFISEEIELPKKYLERIEDLKKIDPFQFDSKKMFNGI